MIRTIFVLAGVYLMTVNLPMAHAVSKDAQELMTLRKKHAPVYCEMSKLYRQLSEARKAEDQAKVQNLTERIQALDKKLSVDSARMEELRVRVRQSPDYTAVREQQVKFDKACNK